MLCKDCDKRYLGCHSNCPEYLEFKRNIEKRQEQKLKDKIIIDYICSVQLKKSKR